MTLSASDVSDAVLEGLERLTGVASEREALEKLKQWRRFVYQLTWEERTGLIDFAISVAEVEVARIEDELANQQYEEDLRAERLAHQHQLDRDDGAEVRDWRHQEDPF